VLINLKSGYTYPPLYFHAGQTPPLHHPPEVNYFDVLEKGDFP